MNKLITTGTLGLAGVVTTGLIAWQAPIAFADQGVEDDARDDRGHHSKAFKREDDSQAVVTTVDDEDDDDTGLGQKGTNTNTNTGGVSQTNTRTRGTDLDDSRGTRTKDMTNDGPGKNNVDHSRNDTNDRSRHNTR